MNYQNILEETLNEFSDFNIGENSNWFSQYKLRAYTSYVNELDYISRSIKKGSTVLEYGSAPFIFTKSLDYLGYKVIGTDINPFRFHNFEKLDLDIRQVNYDREPLPIESNSIDAIVCNEVFEHMRINLIFTFEEALRVLKPSGKIYIATPNLKSFMGIYKFLLKDIAYSCASDLHHEWSKIERIGHMGHIREYTSSEVSNFLEKIGFEITSVEFYGDVTQVNNKVKRNIVNLLLNIMPSLRPSLRIIAKKPQANRKHNSEVSLEEY